MCVGPVCVARDRITESRDNIVFTAVSRYVWGFVNELDRDCVRLMITRRYVEGRADWFVYLLSLCTE